jgi:hypothetical protein
MTPPRIPSRVRRKRGEKGSLTFRGTTKSSPPGGRRRRHHGQRTRPDTCRQCSGNQAVNTYRAAGRAAEAIPLHQQTLAAFERVLGPDHPDTLASRNNLGDTYC